MADANTHLRVTVRIRQLFESGLFDELAPIGPYYRSKRLVHLAMLGLAAEKRGMNVGVINAGSPVSHPAPAIPTTVTETPASSPKVQAKKTQTTSAESKPADTGLPPLEADLSELWQTGIMGVSAPAS